MVNPNPIEATVLRWPEGWPRTRPQDQKANASWRRTANQYRDLLSKELAKMGAPTVLISCNVPLTDRGQLTAGREPRDVGVAVYFSRKKAEDFSWQQTLELTKVMYPTEDEVDAQFRRLAAPHHPDRPGGDLAMFQKFATARDQAKRWIKRDEHQSFDYVIACDTFREVRLNIAALVTSIRAIRALERVGTSAILERAFKGFSALPAAATDGVGAR
jgi:hypothetical protein